MQMFCAPTEDIEALKYNTAIAALMTLLNNIYEVGQINRAELRTLLVLLNPFAPHITEEMWETLGFGEMLAKDGVWPTFDAAKCVDASVEIVVQICGKIRAKLQVPTFPQKMRLHLPKRSRAFGKSLQARQL